MIRIGELPMAPRPIAARRTLAYTGRRKEVRPRVRQPFGSLAQRRGDARSTRAPAAPAVNNGLMIFDQPPAELPVATLRPRDTGAQLVLDARGWLAARWQWLRPRAIPVAAAFAGMLAVLASASYLRDLAQQPPEQLSPPVIATSRPDEPMARIRIHTGPPGAGTFVANRAPAVIVVNRNGSGEVVKLKVEPGVHRIQLEPVAPAPPAP